MGVRLSPWSLGDVAGWASAQQGLISPAVRCESWIRYFVGWVEYANWQSGQVESLVIDCRFDSDLGY